MMKKRIGSGRIVISLNNGEKEIVHKPIDAGEYKGCYYIEDEDGTKYIYPLTSLRKIVEINIKEKPKDLEYGKEK